MISLVELLVSVDDGGWRGLVSDLMWLHKRARQLKPLIVNVLNDPKMESDVLFYLQSVNDVLGESSWGGGGVDDVIDGCRSKGYWTTSVSVSVSA